jgi:hypothetical protein
MTSRSFSVLADSAPLISPEYQAQQEHLHATTEYGTAAQAYGGLVSQIIDKMGVTHLLDYGCGSRMSLLKTHEAKAGKLTYQGYDPGAGREDLARRANPSADGRAASTYSSTSSLRSSRTCSITCVELTEVVGVLLRALRGLRRRSCQMAVTRT